MADGYAMASSGQLGVVNLHISCGLGNAMGMLYNAFREGPPPLLVTAGQQDMEYLVTEPVLTADLPTLARPFVKWAAEVHQSGRLTAIRPSRGKNRAGAADRSGVPVAARRHFEERRRYRFAGADAGRAARSWRRRRHRGGRRTPRQGRAAGHHRRRRRGAEPAHKELIALAEAVAAPVYVEFIPNSASFPASHPLYRGMMTRSQAGVRDVLDKHDLVFSVGGDLFTWSLPSNVDPWPPGLPLIHLDTDPWQIGKNYPAQVGDPRRS